ncbi:phosphoribosyltransferase [Pseudoxanthomonas mexicana]|uniref:phosphoribosyltransferase n=1 Tax=Pseudoxanthomonas mexicana TaxID=128785 RepID=UPI0024E1DC3C|nr:hypothetical protein [Pseudoxanthomonas mexicana]
MPQRFEQIAPHGTLLAEGDLAFNLLEYTSHGWREPGNTNQLIGNLQKLPTASAAELRYKQQAIQECARLIAPLLGPTASNWSFVPIPGSKPLGHAEFDDRLSKVLQAVQVLRPDLQLDIRPVLVTRVERDRQKQGPRLTVDELRATLAVLPSPPPGLAENVVLFDDVFTRGTSFKAAEAALREHAPWVRNINGMFIARTIQPPPAVPAPIFFPVVPQP